MNLLDTLPSPTNLILLLISVDIDLNNSFNDISETNWLPLLSFPYFDVIPTVALRVRAKKRGEQIPSVELLNMLKQEPQLMQLERHPSFRISAVEKPLANPLENAYV